MASDQNYRLYNAIDAAVTFKASQAIDEDFESFGQEDAGWKLERLYPALLYMQTRGMRVDIAALERMKEKAHAELAELQSKLQKETGQEINANSPKQVAAYFYGTLGLPPYTKAGGGVTTDDTAMARLARKGIYAANLIQQIRNVRKLLSTYLEVILDPDQRIRCQYNPRGTVTGRLSSSKTIFGTGFNSQNVDSRFKPFIVADEEQMLFECDKSQAEWVVSAYVCGDPRMIEIIESGRDAHCATGCLITGVPEELIAEEADIIGEMTDPYTIHELRAKHFPSIHKHAKFLPRSMSCRQAGKKSNHALNYMMQYRRFSLVNEVPEADAKIMVEAYTEAYVELPNWWRRVAEELWRTRTIVNCFGRPRRFFGNLRDDETIKAAVAHIPQSTVADLINNALIDIYEEGDIDPVMDMVELRFQIHDSILTGIPINPQTSEALIGIRTALDQELSYESREFRIKTDCKAGLNWGKFQSNENPAGMRKLKHFSGDQEDLQEEIEDRWHELTSTGPTLRLSA